MSPLDTTMPPRAILMAGPPAASAGGMYSVAHALGAAVSGAGCGYDVALLDSGGGLGSLGYRRFPVAVATAARRDYDLLHLHVASSGSTLRKAVLAEVGRARGIPYVIHLHGGGYVRFLAGLCGGGRVAVRRFFRRAAAVVVLGERWKDLVESEFGLAPGRVVVVHNGVASLGRERPSAQERPPTIAFLGGVGRPKGVDLLLHALDELLPRPELREWQAVLIGPTPDREIADLARAVDRRTDGRVRLAGPVFGDRKAQLIRDALVFCLPSRAEGLPMALLEAMSAGLACVSADVGSVAEVVEDGVNGLLVPPGDQDALTAALTDLMSDAPRRAALGAQAHRTWLDGFTIDVMTARMVAVWDAALETG